MAGEASRPEGSADSAAFLLSKVGFDVSRRFHAALAPLGLDPRMFAMLRWIAAERGHSQQDLGEALGIPKSRMVALVDELEEHGLVERRSHPSDRRRHALHLTQKGRRSLERAWKVAVAVQEELCAPLSAAEQEQLVGLLRRLAATQEVRLDVHPGLVEPPGP